MGMKRGKKNRADAGRTPKDEDLVFLDFDMLGDADASKLADNADNVEVAETPKLVDDADDVDVAETSKLADAPDMADDAEADNTDFDDEDDAETEDTDFADDENDANQEAVEKKKTMALFLGMILGIVLIVASGLMLLTAFLQYRKADRIYADSRQQFVSVNSVIDMQLQTPAETVSDNTDDNALLFDDSNAWYRLVDVDMEALIAINPDIVGWLHFENMDISYPVLLAEDNDKYLHTSYDGTAVRAGSIFMDCNNTGDFQDSHTILYGHNMKNGSMFGQLKSYRDVTFYQGHEYFQIITGDHIYRYMIFAYEDIPETSFVYQVPFGRSLEFDQFLDEIRQISMISPDINVSREDVVITLSTCSTTGRRFVVHAVRIGEYNRN